ncbi:MAG: hypothetical protein ABII02_01035 [Candidatus Magasanikbacteria bacterium]
MPEKNRPQLHKYPDQGGYVCDDEYYKSLEKRGESFPKIEEITPEEFEKILENQNIVDTCTNEAGRLKRAAKSGAIAHEIPSILHSLANMHLFVNNDDTYGWLKEKDKEMYKKIVRVLWKARKIS